VRPAVYADVDKAPQDVYNWKFLSQFVKRPFPDEAIELICKFMANALGRRFRAGPAALRRRRVCQRPNVGAADWETQYYGLNAHRLRQIKATHDPLNVFSFEQSVSPATS
jgi:Berberine and berberine like